jgi:hypothetical protein
MSGLLQLWISSSRCWVLLPSSLLKTTTCHSEEPFASLEGKLRDEESAFRNLLSYHGQQILRCAQNDNFFWLPSIFNKLPEVRE